MNEYVTEWGHIHFEKPTELVRRDSLKPGDIAHSSHYGARAVKEVLIGGNENQTTTIIWDAPETRYGPRGETYDSQSTIPLISRAPGPLDAAWIEFRKTHADFWDGITMRTAFEAGFAAGQAN